MIRYSITSLGFVAVLVLAGFLRTTDAEASCSKYDYTGSICWTATAFCPTNFAMANGQLLTIREYTALFSLIGTTYGGDGRVTFALPDMRGRTPAGVGKGPDSFSVALGQSYGKESTTITEKNIPPHTHSYQLHHPLDLYLNGTTDQGDTVSPQGAIPAARPTSGPPPARAAYYDQAWDGSDLNPDAVTIGLYPSKVTTETTGESNPLFGLRPAQLVLTACIMIDGPFPPKSG